MKKLFLITVVMFLFLGLSLYGKTKEPAISNEHSIGLAPHQNFVQPNNQTTGQTVPNRDPDYQSYAYEAYPGSPEGPVTFILNDPAGLTSLAATTSSDFIAGATWMEDTWIGCEYDTGNFYTIETDGTMTLIGGNGTACNGVAYDDNSGTLYGSNYSGSSNLYTIDPATGNGTLVGTINSGIIIAMACDNDGNLYGIDILDESLYSIDSATGAGTVIGNTGLSLNYAQDMEYDKDGETCYLSAYTSSGKLYTCDLSTGATTFIGDFPGGMEVTGFAIPYTLAEEGAPAAVSDLVVTPDAGGALSCELTWINPDLTFAGDPLTELLETRVYRDDNLVYTNSSPVIGDPDGYTDALTVSGLYNYSVTAYNSIGEGPAVSFETWVGEDVPNVVEDLLLVGEYGHGHLTWTNPTTGLNGGAFNNAILGYHIERSDGVLYEVTGLLTEYWDTDIPGADSYYYDVTPYNAIGDGGTATSNTVMMGGGDEIFFDDFEAGLGNWNSIINSGVGEWLIYSPPYPNNYNMPPTSSGNVCSADSDEAGSGTTTDCTIELVTTLDLTNYTTVNIQFDNDFNAIDAADYCYVDVTTDGTTWDNVLTFAGVDVTATHEIIDITAFAAGHSSVNIRFHSVQPGWDWWWTIDNVGVYGTVDAVPGFITGTVTLEGGTGDVEDVQVTAAYMTVNPDADGIYEIEILPGTFDVTAILDGYDPDVVSGVVVEESATTSGVDLTLVAIVGADDEVVTTTKLLSNYPNPFNPVTNIAYSIKDVGNVTIDVYNLKGQLVKSLVNEVKETGDYTVIWNGRNNTNKSVSSGVYFYKMVSDSNVGRYTSTKKMILLK